MINKQNRSKVFLLIIGILLIANIVMLSFFIMKKDSGKPERRPDRKAMIADFLKKEIGFNRAGPKEECLSVDQVLEIVRKGDG